MWAQILILRIKIGFKAPYIVLSILLVRGLVKFEFEINPKLNDQTLPGASKGIYYYLMPDFDKLLEPTVWTAGGPTFPTTTHFSAQTFSRNSDFLFSRARIWGAFGAEQLQRLQQQLLQANKHYPLQSDKSLEQCFRDAVLTSLINCFTSFFSGFVIFSTLGYMSELTNRPVSEVVGEVSRRRKKRRMRRTTPIAERNRQYEKKHFTQKSNPKFVSEKYSEIQNRMYSKCSN